MAGSPEAQRRHRAAERVLLKRLKTEMPDVYAKWWTEATTPIEVRDLLGELAHSVESTSPPGGEPAPVESTVPDLLENLARSIDEAKDASKRFREARAKQAADLLQPTPGLVRPKKGDVRKGKRWTGYAWVDAE